MVGDLRVSSAMPDLFQSLQKFDAGHLQIIAEMWGLDLSTRETDAATKELCGFLLAPDLLAEIIDSLSPPAKKALQDLQSKSGRMPWAEFTRRFGKIREMGPGKRDRERPHKTPASPAEALFYRALLARAFFNTPEGALEYAYIPDDLYALLEAGMLPERDTVLAAEPLGRPASLAEKAVMIPSDDSLLDQATTLLAALRLNLIPPETHPPTSTLQAFLDAAGLLKHSRPQPEPIREFLEAPRQAALGTLTAAWSASGTFNELRQVPGLILEGEWQNRPRLARAFLLEQVRLLPPETWWSLPAFIHDLKARHPDFQRPAGEYDSWFIKRAVDGEFLRGFEHWDEVDGALVRYILTGPLHWLGLVDLATPQQGSDPTAFLVRLALPLSGPETALWHVSSQGKITVPNLVPRAARYQLSRFCEWQSPGNDEWLYLITPASLARARDQGLNLEHLLPLLARYSHSGVPPALVKALKRWLANGTEARVQSQIILKVSKPELLIELRKSKAARFLGEVLGPTAVIVKDGAQSKVLALLAELGLLAEDEPPARAERHKDGTPARHAAQNSSHHLKK